MKNTKLIVRTKSKSYPIYFGNNILNKTAKLLNKNIPGVKKICIISDNNLPISLLNKLTKTLKKYELKIYKLSVSEKTKSIRVVNKIIEQLNYNGFGCRPIWELLNRLPPYQKCPSMELKNANKLQKSFISVPSSPILG